MKYPNGLCHNVIDIDDFEHTHRLHNTVRLSATVRASTSAAHENPLCWPVDDWRTR